MVLAALQALALVRVRLAREPVLLHMQGRYQLQALRVLVVLAELQLQLALLLLVCC